MLAYAMPEDGPPPVVRPPRYFLGLDFGTSGARAIAIDGAVPWYP